MRGGEKRRGFRSEDFLVNLRDQVLDQGLCFCLIS